MPQESSRSDSQHNEGSHGESMRAERSRSERSSKARPPSSPFGEIGTRSIISGLRLQKEMLGVLSDIGQQWFSRATSEAELALKLPNKLTAARSMPDALSAYQEWLGEWMSMFGEDSRRFMSDSRRIIDAGVRCFADKTTAPTG
jgi:hypothetical protein